MVFEDPLVNLCSLDIDLHDSLDILLNSPIRNQNNDGIEWEKDGTTTTSPSPKNSDNSNSGDNGNNEPVTSLQLSSESATSASATLRTMDNSDFFQTMNAVHMEVQENAKLPNSYHVPVRRKNPLDSNGFEQQQRQMQQQQQQQHNQQQQQHNNNQTIRNVATAMTDNKVLVDEILRLTEEDLTLTENFLGNGQR
jgi:hypothetical protein